jgi:small subunit ribosomal protein S6
VLAWNHKEKYIMKNYELLTIFKPSLDSDELDKAVDKISADIKSAKGEVSSVDKMGRKKLAYDLQGYRDGFFTTMVVSLPADAIVEFKRNLKLNDNVLRFMFMEVSKKAQTV